MSQAQVSESVGRQYQRCSRCVMDTSAAEIIFDHSGVCNFCTEFLERSHHVIYEDERKKELRLRRFVDAVKKEGVAKPYDCVVGVSGGVDSSWTLVEAKRLGLRPLAVHMDNGWNSELAQSNIANLVKGLGVDLYTHVIDWTEYRQLMQAFFDADVIDVELLYDNAMTSVCYEQASRFNVKYILAGTNQSTEGMRMPAGWNWYKRDAKNIKAIGSRFANVKIKTFPLHSTFDFFKNEFGKGIRWHSFLDYLPFKKEDATRSLEVQYQYKRYPYKHYESIFTRFYQGHILPLKFGVDKRLLHLSTLIISGQMSREDALVDLEGIPYQSEKELQEDLSYFLKKMAWTPSDFDNYVNRPPICHSKYPSEAALFNRIRSSLSPRTLLAIKKWLGK